MTKPRITENQRQCLLSWKGAEDAPLWNADARSLAALWEKGLIRPDTAYGGVNVNDAMFRLTALGKATLGGKK